MGRAVSIAIKLVAFTTVVLGIAVLAVCGWTLSNTFRKQNQPDLIEEELQKNATVWNNWEDELTESNTRMWNNMSDNFRVLIQGCVAGAITCALLQLLISVIVLFTAARKILGKARIWQWMSFNIILLLHICILVPLSYNREKDSLRGSSSFAKHMKNEVAHLYRAVTDQDESFFYFFLNDLNSYYIMLGFNCVMLLTLLLFSCCLTRCRCSDPYHSV